MNYAMTFSAALAVLVASFCVGLLEILSAPERVNYPSASLHVRVSMFAWAVFLGYRGLEMLTLLNQPTPAYVTPGAFYASITLMLAQMAVLEQHMRSWLPAHTHERIRRLMDVASCRQRERIERRGLVARVRR